MAESLNTQIRGKLGRGGTKQLRRTGQIPAELYGHGLENVHLSIPANDAISVIRHGTHLVELKGAVNESALIREVQWDTFGSQLLHVDLARVSAEETVEVTIAVEIKGVAAGAKDGGIVQHVLHDVRILCPAGVIPDKLEARISGLQLGGHFTASELVLPEGASLLTSPEQIIAICAAPAAQAEVAAAPAEVNEPELIGRKPKEEDEASEE